MRNLKITP